MSPNLRPIVFGLKVRTKGSQPSICVRTFSLFTSLGEGGSAQVGIAEVSSVEVGFAEVGSAQVGSTQVGSTQNDSAETGSAEIGFAETGPAEIGLTLRMLFPPLVPYLYTLFENIQMPLIAINTCCPCTPRIKSLRPPCRVALRCH